MSLPHRTKTALLVSSNGEVRSVCHLDQVTSGPASLESCSPKTRAAKRDSAGLVGKPISAIALAMSSTRLGQLFTLRKF